MINSYLGLALACPAYFTRKAIPAPQQSSPQGEAATPQAAR